MNQSDLEVGSLLVAKYFRFKTALVEKDRCVAFQNNVRLAEKAELGGEQFFVVDADLLPLNAESVCVRHFVVHVIHCSPIAVRWERIANRRRIEAVFVPVLVDVLVSDAYVVDDTSVIQTLGAGFVKLTCENGTRDNDKIESAANSVEVRVSQKRHRSFAGPRIEIRTVEIRGVLQRKLLQLI